MIHVGTSTLKVYRSLQRYYKTPIGFVWNRGFSKEKQRNEFHRKVFSTWCLEQRKLTFLSKGKAKLASQNIGKKASKET